jgi:hypothetical protein
MPFQLVGEFISFIACLVVDIVTPIVNIVLHILKLKVSVVKLIVMPLCMGLAKIATFIFENIASILGVIREGYLFCKRFVRPLSNQRNRETTLSFLQICQQIGLQWSQSIGKRVIQGAKAVYDFTIYVSTEISKHRTSLYLSLVDIWRKKLSPRI